MKRVRKILTAVLTMVMILAMGVTTFAATVTINDANGDSSEYSAYKLFSATVDEGEVGDESDDKVAYQVNSTYATILSTITGKTLSSDMVDYIAGLDTTDKKREFADTVYEKITEANIAADATTTVQEFTLAPG